MGATTDIGASSDLSPILDLECERRKRPRGVAVGQPDSCFLFGRLGETCATKFGKGNSAAAKKARIRRRKERPGARGA